jgi:hypothetical protein
MIFLSFGRTSIEQTIGKERSNFSEFWSKKYPHQAGIFITGGELLLRSEACCRFIPVNHVPECLDVVWTFVLIFQVVSVFPHVQAHDWEA